MSVSCKHCGAVAGRGYELGHKSDCPARIVGHKTFAKSAEARRAELMPDEQSAIRALFDAWLRLKDFGWKDPMYCPKDGSRFKIIELGSTGIFEGVYRGEWPEGSWDSWDEHDSYCSSIAPAMFKLFPEDEEKRKAKMKEAAERFAADRA